MFLMVMFTIAYGRISARSAENTSLPKKWFEVEKTMLPTRPKVIQRTELEHEMHEFWARVNQTVLQVVLILFLHLYIGNAEAVVIQGGMNVSSLSQTIDLLSYAAITYDKCSQLFCACSLRSVYSTRWL